MIFPDSLQILKTTVVNIQIHMLSFCGPGSSVDIATELRAGRSGIESRWRREFSSVQTVPGDYPASCTMGTGSFTGVKCGQGVLLTTQPFQCRGHGRAELYLYPPSWPHRACNGITLPLPFYVLRFHYNYTVCDFTILKLTMITINSKNDKEISLNFGSI